MRKRSVTLQGHTTSVSVEDEFWVELKRMAAERGMALGRLVEEVDGERRAANLSAALRLAVLADLKAKLGSPGSRP